MKVKWFIVGWIARSAFSALAEYRWERYEERMAINAIRSAGRSMVSPN